MVGLGNVGEDGVDHRHEHAVLHGVPGILDDGDDVGAAGSHVDEVTTGAVRELDGIHGAGGTDDVSDMGDGGTRGGTEVEDLGTRLHINGVKTSEDTRSQLTPEGVPDSVLGLRRRGRAVLVSALAVLNGDTLLAVDGLAGDKVSRGKQILLSTAGHEDTGVTMGLLQGSAY